MKQITRVQELEDLKQEAIARIRAVLDLRGSDYELIPQDWDDDLDEEDIVNIRNSPSFILPIGSIAQGSPTKTRYVIGVAKDPQWKSLILIDTCDVIGYDDQTFRIDKADLPCILAIADRIDELEKTGIHLPQDGSVMNVMGGPPRIIRERDTYNPTGI